MRIRKNRTYAARAAERPAHAVMIVNRALLVVAGLTMAGCGIAIGPERAGTGIADAPEPAAANVAPAPETPAVDTADAPTEDASTEVAAVVPQTGPETAPDLPAITSVESPDQAPTRAIPPRPEEPAAAEVASAAPARATPGIASLRPRARPKGLAASASAGTKAASAQPGTVAPPVLHDPTLRLAQGAGSCPRRLAGDMPRRPGAAPEGQTFMARLASVSGTERDRHVTRQILSGNMPGLMRRLAPVSFSGRLRDGSRATLTLCVTPDYLALGSDSDFVRVPLGLRAATRIAEEFDMLLPTAQIVDLIYRAADLRLTPRPMPPGPRMTTTAYLLEHNATVEGQRRQAGAGGDALVSGHKKDLVLTNRITRNPSRVAIYGWHRPGGEPIQPLSTVHGAEYADYSHGVRLVSRTAYLDGQPVDLRHLLSDPRYAVLVTREGPIRGPRLLMASLAGN